MVGVRRLLCGAGNRRGGEDGRVADVQHTDGEGLIVRGLEVISDLQCDSVFSHIIFLGGSAENCRAVPVIGQVEPSGKKSRGSDDKGVAGIGIGRGDAVSVSHISHGADNCPAGKCRRVVGPGHTDNEFPLI